MKSFTDNQIEFAKWLYEHDMDENSPLHDIIPTVKGFFALDRIANFPNQREQLEDNFPKEIECLNESIEENYDVILKEWKKHKTKQE